MLVLAVESATELAGVALADEAGVIAVATTSRGRRHAESIVPSVALVCDRAGTSVRALDGVCVDVGPGLFTGLRVGIATAKALAFALGIPVVTATSLEVLAQALCGAGAAMGSLLVPVVDARRGEVFCARFRVTSRDAGDIVQVGDGDIVQVGEDLLCSPEDLVAFLSQLVEPFVLAGDGVLRYVEMLGELPGARLASAALASPPVDVLATIGVARLRAGLGLDAAKIAPRYLREADARINWEQRLPPREPSRTVF
ncbi:MAG: tRNA (adenosine(37)-N6)-threonylcarbamoyltransferase complex dimerization subunit type 1 TsaB [Acidimicrobiales bacterium]